MSHSELAEIKKQIVQFIQMGFVLLSKSLWASPVLFVSNKEGILGFCLDYRALNRFPIKNSYPLPRMDTLMDRIAWSQYFSTIDLRSGYPQIRISEKDIPKTAFSTRYGHYEYTVVPFGLTNAPAAFMGVMNDVFKDYTDSFIMVYLDDIVVYRNSWNEHVCRLKLVLDRLRKQKLYAKLSKWTFGV